VGEGGARRRSVCTTRRHEARGSASTRRPVMPAAPLERRCGRTRCPYGARSAPEITAWRRSAPAIVLALGLVWMARATLLPPDFVTEERLLSPRKRRIEVALASGPVAFEDLARPAPPKVLAGNIEPRRDAGPSRVASSTLVTIRCRARRTPWGFDADRPIALVFSTSAQIGGIGSEARDRAWPRAE